MVQAPPINNEVFVLTDVLEEGGAVTEEIFDRVVELAESRGVPLLSVCLDCEPEENARRLRTERRSEQGKLRDVEVLMGFRKTLKLLRRKVPHRLDLDTTEMAPEAVAEEIVRAREGVARGAGAHGSSGPGRHEGAPR